MEYKSKASLFIISSLALALTTGLADAVVVYNAGRGRAPNRTEQYSDIRARQREAEQYQYDSQYGYSTDPADLSAQAAVAAMPVAISNPIIAKALADGDETYGVTSVDLDECAAIYPSGKMTWAAPNAGARRTQTETCAVIIEMRAISGNSDIILGRAVVGAGDTIDCNISSFPASGYTDAAGEIIFPADREPTMDDVTRVMNTEQKQNAAIKIAAGAVVGALGGNFIGPSDSGKPLDTNKEKMQSTVIGALAGAGLMTANTYTGKVAGDTILSTGINASMGALVGNMVATGRALMVQKCTVPEGETDCLYGVVQRYDAKALGQRFYNLDDGKTAVCDAGDFRNCDSKTIIGFTVNGKTADAWMANNFYALRNDPKVKQYCLNAAENRMTEGGVCNGTWVLAEGGGTPISPVAAMIPGFSGNDYARWRAENPGMKIYERLGDGSAGVPLSAAPYGYTMANFYPTYQDAEDGGIIDFNNRARTKGTLIGAGAGGALGGVSGYMGAVNDVELRWVSEVQSYKDSLQKIYCGTGTRFLGQYNDVIIVPAIKRETK